MPVVEIRDTEKYDRAVGLLVRLGGTFHTRPTQKLIVDRRQFQALVGQGLVTAKKVSSNGRGKKAKNATA